MSQRFLSESQVFISWWFESKQMIRLCNDQQTCCSLNKETTVKELIKSVNLLKNYFILAIQSQSQISQSDNIFIKLSWKEPSCQVFDRKIWYSLSLPVWMLTFGAIMKLQQIIISFLKKSIFWWSCLLLRAFFHQILSMCFQVRTNLSLKTHSNHPLNYF